jgi:hypothetical protein
MAVEAHVHDERYMTKGDLYYGRLDAVVGAVRMSFGQQRRWVIQSAYACVLPETYIENGAELSINDGGELTLVG